MAGMDDIIARIDALLANTPQSEIEEFEVTRCLRDCRDEIIAARACAEMMLQGTGQRLAEDMAKRVIDGQTIGAWIPVSERLPEEDEDVLVMTAEGKFASGGMHVASLDEDGVWYPSHGDGWEFPDVTHWMPLPEPPEVK